MELPYLKDFVPAWLAAPNVRELAASGLRIPSAPLPANVPRTLQRLAGASLAPPHASIALRALSTL